MSPYPLLTRGSLLGIKAARSFKLSISIPSQHGTQTWELLYLYIMPMFIILSTGGSEVHF